MGYDMGSAQYCSVEAINLFYLLCLFLGLLEQ